MTNSLILSVCLFGSLACAPALQATSVSLSVTPSSAVFGSAVQLAATVQGCAPPSGARVAFYDGATLLGTGTLGASSPFTTTTLPTGQRSLRAYYPGDPGCAAASSAAVPATISSTASNFFNFRPSYSLPGATMTAVGDFNGDGKLDVAVANAANVTILLGNGDATFTTKGAYGAGFTSSAVAVGDWNRDGRLDLVISGGGSTAVLVGNGDGSFQAPTAIWTGSGPLAVADFNGDGNADIAVSSASSNAIAILRGTGNGAFLSATMVSTLPGPAPGNIAIGDFNRDGKTDLFVVVNPASPSIAVLTGNGDGTFQAPGVYGGGIAYEYTRAAIAVGDFNGDGADDIAISGPLTVFLNDGNGGFRPGVRYYLGSPANAISAMDFNGDGILDFIVSIDDVDEPRFGVVSGNGDGTFQLGWYEYPGGHPYSFAPGDFNGDGRVDLAMAYAGWLKIAAGVTANFLFDSPGTVPAGSTFTAKVRVIDSSGLPIAGLDVRSPDGYSWGWTDATGTVTRTLTAGSTGGLYWVKVYVLGPPDGSLAGGFGAAEFPILVAAPPTSLQPRTQAQSAEVGTRFVKPLLVQLNQAPGVTVTFSAPSTGASAVLSSSTAVTDRDGFASVTAVANNIVGSYAVTATAAGFTATFPMTNIARSIAGCWTFDLADIGGAGPQAADCSGNGLAATIFGYASTAGAVREALSFSGSAYATAPDSAATDLMHDLTLAVWVKSTNNTQKQNVISKYNFSGAESGYLLQLLPNGTVNLRLGGNNVAFGARDNADATVIDDGKWRHVAVVITTGVNIKFYIDGRLRSTVATGALASRTTSPLYFGALPGSYNGLPFQGALDEPRIYSRALTAGEVAALLGFPTITSIVPGSVPYGRPATITINGTNFVPSSVVIEPDMTSPPANTIAILQPVFLSSTQLAVTLPRDYTTATIRLQVFNAAQNVYTPGYPVGPGSNIVRYPVDALMPEIASIRPYSAAAGGPGFSLTVRGANFAEDCLCVAEPVPGARVYWNGAMLQPTGGTSTTLTAFVPASLIATAGTANITVVNPVGISSRNLQFKITSGPPALTLTCVPSTGPTQVGVAYSTTCTLAGGIAPHVMAIDGTVPAGISMTAATGTSMTVAGTPTTAGAYSFSVVARDSSTPALSAAQTFAGTIAPSTPPPPPPSGGSCWSFDAADISGAQALDRCASSNGTIVNAAPITGKVNQALRFNGAGSYVSIPDNPALQLNHDLTIAAWIQTANTTEKQDFLSKYDFSGAEYGYMLQTLPSGVLNLRVGGNNVSGATRDFPDTRPINDGQWHHVVVVITSSGAAFYVDGQPTSTKAFNRIASANWATMYLGTFPGAYNGLPFQGALDEVRIYSQALTAADILALFNGAYTPPSITCNPESGPRWPVPYYQTCTVSGGTAPYTVTVASLPTGLNWSPTTNGVGISGTPQSLGAYSYSIQASDSAAPTPHSVTKTITGTVEQTSPAVLTGFSPPSWNAGTRLRLTVYGTGFQPGAVVVEPDAPPGVHYQQTTFVSSTELQADLWGDLTFFPSTLRFQVMSGGAASNILPFTVSAVPATITSISPASATAGGPGFTLTVRGTNFFDHCDCNLGPEAGTFIYWNGKPVDNPLYTGVFISSTELRINVPAALIATAGTAAITVNGPPNGGFSNAVTFTILPTPPQPVVTPAAYWSLDAASVTGNTVLDGSGNGLNGTLQLASVAGTLVPGKVNQAFVFSPASYVSVPDAVSLQLRHDLTLTGWIKVTPNIANGVAQTQNVISKYDFSGAESGYILQVAPSGALKLRIGGNNLASGSRDATDSRVIADGQWHHFAVVIPIGQSVKFYVDGVLSSTVPQVAMASGHPVTLYLGLFPGAFTGGFFNGSLDEIRIYAAALSAPDIAALSAQ